jgi:hypothetical protein
MAIDDLEIFDAARDAFEAVRAERDKLRAEVAELRSERDQAQAALRLELFAAWREGITAEWWQEQVRKGNVR